LPAYCGKYLTARLISSSFSSPLTKVRRPKHQFIASSPDFFVHIFVVYMKAPKRKSKIDDAGSGVRKN